MDIFRQALNGLGGIENIRDSLKKKGGWYHLTGVNDAGKALGVYGIGCDIERKVIVSPEEERAEEMFREYSFYEDNVYYYPGKDYLFFQSDVRGNALSVPRLGAIEAIIKGGSYTIITTVGALLNAMPPKNKLKDGIIHIETGDTIDLGRFRKKLVADGYEPADEVSEPGQMAVRGGIIDVFPLTHDRPLRIELFDDEIDSIRIFDAGTQRTVEVIDKTDIFPATEYPVSDKEVKSGLALMKRDMKKLYDRFRESMKTEEAARIKNQISEAVERIESGSQEQEIERYALYFINDTVSILDYLPDDTVVFADESRHVEEAAKEICKEFNDSMERRLLAGYLLPKQMSALTGMASLKASLDRLSGVLMTTLDQPGKLFNISDQYNVNMRTVTSFNGSLDMLMQELRSYRNRRFRTVVLSPSRSRAKRIAGDIESEGLLCFYSDTLDRTMAPGDVMVASGNMRKGIELPDSSFVFISESDIFGQEKKKKRKKKTAGNNAPISAFRDLHQGDYVVHENHGLGIYRGIEKIEVDGVMKDYIKIEYSGGSNLYVLATQLDTIQKYGSADGKRVKLATLGSQEWSKTKSRVRSAVGQVAKDLVALYAERQKIKGYAFEPDTEWQREFEETFPYTETESQSAAIMDVKQDMESDRIMDRLICGDVGFGKTEIAMRAAFKAIQENKQAVVLVPTTILAEQHYNTFSQRMKDFPVNIELLSRFRTRAEIKESLERIASGEADIIIGTHRVLSDDVHFHDLGLLIIDEEQRFGVANKDKIKKLKKNVDVLSLSATPIPRTLHMSMTGIRDMSVLEEAPQDRRPIQTFVFEYNEELVREAIQRELSRKGQVYYVINRVRNIADVAAGIQSMVPDATVAYAHGRMNENTLEDIMMRFINKEIDVLVSTTIIETGLDISNVNTIIIHDADKMGLSQLYQLRGRVGRGSRTAYAFFLYKRDKILKEEAEKRLSAIREFTDLGSGIKIALRDLEIRGAGNLLGKEQSGHMEAVGYDLYCKMLNAAVRREKGEKVEDDFDTSVYIDIDAFIPESYIRNELERLDIYKRIASIGDAGGEQDMTDELIDRFGEPPKSVINLIRISILRSFARKAYITEIRQKPEGFRILLYRKAGIDPSRLGNFISSYGASLQFRPDKESPEFTLFTGMNSREAKKDPVDILMEFSRRLYEETVY